ncbi:primosomal protein N', partial [Burkholderia contaminans]
AALRRLAQALVDTGSLALPDARALHPKAAATLDDWAARGWVDVEEIGWADAPVPKAVDNLLAAGGRTVPPALTDQQAEALDA